MERKRILKIKELAGGDDGARTRDLMRDRSRTLIHAFQYRFSSHRLTLFRGFCFRSKSKPFSISYIGFWYSFGTAAGRLA